jgi:DNA polymerase V
MAKVKIYRINGEAETSYPVIGSVSAGFPSPAGDFVGDKIDLNKYLIKNKPSTFIAVVDGLSMIGANIDEGDLLIIDKSLPPVDGKIAICVVDGGFTVKRISVKKDHWLLLPENEKFKPIRVDKDNEFVIWGMVTAVIKKTY